MYNDQGQQEKELLILSWSNILYRFNRHFGSTFSTSKKAHFDCLPPKFKVVDGARLKWCNLLLLDAIISILDNDIINTSTRRAFNQQKVLNDAIIKEFRCNHCTNENDITDSQPFPTSSKEIKHESSSSTKKFVFKKGGFIPSDIDLDLHSISSPWNDLKSLREAMLQTPTTKSREKYLKIVQQLMDHRIVHQFESNLVSLQRAVVMKAMKAFNASLQNVVNSEPTPACEPAVIREKRLCRVVSNYNFSDVEDKVKLESDTVSHACEKFSDSRPASRSRYSIKSERMSWMEQLMERGSRSHADAFQLLHNSRYKPTLTHSVDTEEEQERNSRRKRMRLGKTKSINVGLNDDETETCFSHDNDTVDGHIAPPTTPINSRKRKNRLSASEYEQVNQEWTPCQSSPGFDSQVNKLDSVLSPLTNNTNTNCNIIASKNDPLPHWSTYEKFSTISLFDQPVDQCDQDFWEHLHGLLETSNPPLEDGQHESLTDSCDNSTSSDASPEPNPIWGSEVRNIDSDHNNNAQQAIKKEFYGLGNIFDRQSSNSWVW